MQPHEYPRRILVSVSGLSPQIVTETLYALTQTLDPSFVPTEVHLLTTRRGADYARKTLLGSDPGWFHGLCRDYGLSGIQFGEGNIHTLRDGDGSELDDIRTDGHNKHAADQIIEFVRRLAADQRAALHVSIAGGRKTMGYYAGYALSLFGRGQDKLSHVLVAEQFEGHPEFFYRTPKRNIIRAHDKDKTPLDTSEAKVDLAIIPFVRLRPKLDENLLSGRATFSRTVEAAQRSLGSAELVLDSDLGLAQCSGEIVRLKPAGYAFLAWFARRAQEGKSPIGNVKSLGVEEAQEYLAEYDGLPGSSKRTYKRISAGMEAGFFQERLSHLNKALQRALGPVAAEPYLVRTGGRKGKSCYFLALEPDQIRFDDIDTPRGKRAAKPSTGARKGGGSR